jgi:hypothetical protein
MEDIPGNFMMIGLHKLAAERDDGLIPELLALYAARERLAGDAPASAEPQLDARNEESVKSAGNDNVIAFRPYLLAKKKRR